MDDQNPVDLNAINQFYGGSGESADTYQDILSAMEDAKGNVNEAGAFSPENRAPAFGPQQAPTAAPNSPAATASTAQELAAHPGLANVNPNSGGALAALMAQYSDLQQQRNKNNTLTNYMRAGDKIGQSLAGRYSGKFDADTSFYDNIDKQSQQKVQDLPDQIKQADSDIQFGGLRSANDAESPMSRAYRQFVKSKFNLDVDPKTSAADLQALLKSFGRPVPSKFTDIHGYAIDPVTKKQYPMEASFDSATGIPYFQGTHTPIPPEMRFVKEGLSPFRYQKDRDGNWTKVTTARPPGDYAIPFPQGPGTNGAPPGVPPMPGMIPTAPQAPGVTVPPSRGPGMNTISPKASGPSAMGVPSAAPMRGQGGANAAANNVPFAPDEVMPNVQPNDKTYLANKTIPMFNKETEKIQQRLSHVSNIMQRLKDAQTNPAALPGLKAELARFEVGDQRLAQQEFDLMSQRHGVPGWSDWLNDKTTGTISPAYADAMSEAIKGMDRSIRAELSKTAEKHAKQAIQFQLKDSAGRHGINPNRFTPQNVAPLLYGEYQPKQLDLRQKSTGKVFTYNDPAEYEAASKSGYFDLVKP